MKDSNRRPSPSDSQSAPRSVSLRIRDNQVTFKVNTPVPQARPMAGWPAR